MQVAKEGSCFPVSSSLPPMAYIEYIYIYDIYTYICINTCCFVEGADLEGALVPLLSDPDAHTRLGTSGRAGSHQGDAVMSAMERRDEFWLDHFVTCYKQRWVFIVTVKL